MSLQLGDVVFADMEVPDTMPIGGAHAHKLHKLQGGARKLDAMGRDDEPKTWSGRMLGPGATDRVQLLDSYRIAGQAIDLSWDTFFFTVFVTQFRAEQLQTFHWTYSITVEVLVDRSDTADDTPSSDVDDQTDQDMDRADGFGDQIGDDGLTSDLGDLRSAISAVPSFLSATTSQIGSVLVPLGVAQATVSGLISSVDAGLSAFAGPIGGLPPADLAQSLIGVASDMTDSASLYGLRAVLGRMDKNIANVQLAGSQIVTDGFKTLHDYAAEHFGDVAEWATIAKANGLTDPVVAAGTTLLIPTRAGKTGGVLV